MLLVAVMFTVLHRGAMNFYVKIKFRCLIDSQWYANYNNLKGISRFDVSIRPNF